MFDHKLALKVLAMRRTMRGDSQFKARVRWSNFCTGVVEPPPPLPLDTTPMCAVCGVVLESKHGEYPERCLELCGELSKDDACKVFLAQCWNTAHALAGSQARRNSRYAWYRTAFERGDSDD